MDEYLAPVSLNNLLSMFEERDRLSLQTYKVHLDETHNVVLATRELKRMRDLAVELAKYFTSLNSVPVERATIRRESDLFLLLQEVLPHWQFTAGSAVSSGESNG